MTTTSARKKKRRNKILFVGIDPGSTNGAIAIINSKRRALLLKKLPKVKIYKLKTTKKGNPSVTFRTCEQQLHHFFLKLSKSGYRIVVCIEQIMPQGGLKAVGLAIAMDSAAVVRALCAAHGFSYLLVEPKIWQGHFYRIPKGVDPKEVSLQDARRKHPEVEQMLQTANADGFADALHLADYGRQKTLLVA